MSPHNKISFEKAYVYIHKIEIKTEKMLFILIYKFFTLATCSNLGQSENFLQ